MHDLKQMDTVNAVHWDQKRTVHLQGKLFNVFILLIKYWFVLDLTTLYFSSNSLEISYVVLSYKIVF